MIQILFDSLLRACELSLLAVGLTMVYALLRFANFAHVEFATVGGFIAWFVNATLGAPLLVAIALAALASGFLGWAMDRLVFTRLRRTPPIQMMIASFGIGIVMRESVRAIWGPAARFYPMGLQRPLHFLGTNMTPIQLWIVAAAIASMLGFHFLLNRTNLGIAMRATADDAGLAQACGIHTQQLIGRVWFIGSAFAALGGVMIGLETQISPQLGFGIIIPVFAAAILGGIGNPYGAVLGAVILACAENFGLAIDWAPLLHLAGIDAGTAYIPASYREAIPFAILIGVLLVRPQGILGHRSA